MNIKNPHVHELAREAARRTGKSQTSVIEEALERLLAEMDTPTAEEKYARLIEIADDAASRLTEDDKQAMSTIMEEMYDEHGLPQ
ncbi:MAG: type II toxin-antitoxin system VapB family antitoxin [Nocardioidaceae bacterium]